VDTGRACYTFEEKVVSLLEALRSLRSSDPDCWNSDTRSDASFDSFEKIADTIKSYLP
jgi:hypothetical protein